MLNGRFFRFACFVAAPPTSRREPWFQLEPCQASNADSNYLTFSQRIRTAKLGGVGAGAHARVPIPVVLAGIRDSKHLTLESTWENGCVSPQ